MLELYYLKEADSVCSNRAVITLIEKGIADWTPRYIHLLDEDHFDKEYLAINPKAVVPTLVHDGNPIRESSIICDYIDELKPEPALKPAGLLQRTYMREWIKESDEVAFPGVAALNFVTRFRSTIDIGKLESRWKKQPDLEKTLRQKSVIEYGMDSEWVLRGLVGWDRIFAKMETALSDSRPWIMGEQFTLVESCYAPLIKVLDMIKWLDVWFEFRPHVSRWWQALGSRPSVLGLDEVAIVFGSGATTGRGKAGLVRASARSHGVGNLLSEPDSPESFSLVSVTQRQSTGVPQREAVAFTCAACSTEIYREEFDSTPPRRGRQRDEVGPVAHLHTIYGSAQAALNYNAEEKNRTCPECGHVNAPFPLGRWGWDRYRDMTDIIREAHQSLSETAAAAG